MSVGHKEYRKTFGLVVAEGICGPGVGEGVFKFTIWPGRSVVLLFAVGFWTYPIVQWFREIGGRLGGLSAPLFIVAVGVCRISSSS